MRIYIVFIAILFTSCNNRNSNEFLKIVTNDSVVWIFYEGDYLHYKKVGFNTRYKFFEDGTYQDTLSAKPFGRGEWTVINNMININADSYHIKSYNSDSIILENNKGLQARLYNTKSSAAKSLIQYNDSDQKNN